MNTRRYFTLLKEIAVTRYKLKDQNTMLGFAWSFLHPVIMLGLMFILFSARLGQGIDHYAIYLLIGLVQFSHFSSSTNRSMHVLISMRSLTSDAIFPKELLVIGSVIADVIELFAAMVVCVTFAKLSGVDLSWAVFALPYVFLLQLMLVLWVSLCLSCLYVFVRDMTYVYQAFTRLLLFATPIFYAPSFLEKGAAQYIVWLNPLAHLVGFSRSVILDGQLFPLHQSILFFAINLVLLYGSIKMFRKYEPIFAEYV
jgi:ABC-type polysaccharide/polyol phosphate export systems, permease component